MCSQCTCIVIVRIGGIGIPIVCRWRWRSVNQRQNKTAPQIQHLNNKAVIFLLNQRIYSLSLPRLGTASTTGINIDTSIHLVTVVITPTATPAIITAIRDHFESILGPSGQNLTMTRMLGRWPVGHLDLDGHLADGALYLLAIGPTSDDGPIGTKGVFPPHGTIIEGHWWINYLRRSLLGIKSLCPTRFRSLRWCVFSSKVSPMVWGSFPATFVRRSFVEVLCGLNKEVVNISEVVLFVTRVSQPVYRIDVIVVRPQWRQTGRYGASQSLHRFIATHATE